ncbi:hypothetical protein [Burkholderia sp. BCC1630]|uniref:hypothetical protein n=1 Tax=Burkholderia sp. BCC1630 TaxID=2676304 RepID=UPI00158B3AA1|nr:hypothetical protein [Burkholderia sp. BCC1630]
MGKKFAEEIAYLPSTIRWALGQDIDLLARVIASNSGRSLLAIGSGGSLTSAAFLAQLHESEFRRISRQSTPVDFFAHETRPEDCAVVLVSAEGKNKDVLAASLHMLTLEVPGFALTLAPDSPLADRLRASGATVTAFAAPWGKDGYLATNSLIATMILVARGYAIDGLQRYLEQIDEQWLELRRGQIAEQGLGDAVDSGRDICVLYGRDGIAGAIDIESKIAESAIGVVQKVDFRQFAHGRHLQLANRELAPCFVSFESPRDRILAQATIGAFPANVPVVRLDLPAEHALAEIVSVIDAILLTDILSQRRGIDPGQPDVPEFGRAMHASDVREAIRGRGGWPPALVRKVRNVDAPRATYETFRLAGVAFADRLEQARFRALVCDFDGTFCNTDLRFDGLDGCLISEIARIAGAGFPIGFATGRGDSLHSDLRAKLDEELWERITIGFYSGSIVSGLAEAPPVQGEPDPRFVELTEWLTTSTLLGALKSSPKIGEGQLSLRILDHSAKYRVGAYVREWLDAKGYEGWRIFYSGHSIDVVTEFAGKSKVVSALAAATGCDSDSDILRLGDSGDIEGNDYEFLNAGLGLSVGGVSIAKNSCWNFLPRGLIGARGTQFYLKALVIEGGALRFASEFIEHVRAILTVPGFGK